MKKIFSFFLDMFQQIAAWHSKMSQMLKSSLGELNVRKHEIEILQKVVL